MKKFILLLLPVIVLVCGLQFWRQSRPLAPVRTLHVSGKAISTLFSPDGKTLAVLTTPNTEFQSPYYDLELWDVATWQRKRILPHVKFFLAFSPDSKTLFAGEDSVQQWNLATGRLAHTYPNIGYLVRFSHDTRLLVTAQASVKKGRVLGSTLTVWDTVRQKALHVITVPGTDVNFADAKFAPDGSLLAVGGSNPGGQLTLWNMKTGQQITALTGRMRGEQQSAFSRDGKILAAGGSNHKITLWDTQTWQPIRTFPEDLETTRDLNFSVSGTRLLASGEVATGQTNSSGQKEMHDSLTMWDAQTGAVILHLSDRFSAAFSHDGRFLATQGAGMTLWNTKDGSQVATYRDKQTPIIYIAFSPDDRLLSTTDVRSDRVNLWAVPTL